MSRIYKFEPVLGDLCMPQHWHAEPGQLVKITRLPGAPPPGTMGQVHIVDAETGDFLGMVYKNSLLPAKGLRAGRQNTVHVRLGGGGFHE